MVAVNQQVQVLERTTATTLTGGTVEVIPGFSYRITRLGSSKAVVRRGNRSLWVPLTALHDTDGRPVGAAAAATRARPIGQTPEGDHIAIDDPRIAWIWEDAGRVADQHNHCGEYDSLTAKLGAPGRARAFNVTTKVEGLDAVISVVARSQKEASAKVMEKIATAKIERVVDTGRRR